MLANYHRFLFQWHCRKFFRFRRYLSQLEKDYLEVCFGLAEGFSEASPGGYQHFSYYSYSHRVQGERVNSSRLAYGSIAHPEKASPAARAVLQERGLQIDPFYWSLDSAFYGLGWDVEEDQFKVYFRLAELGRLPESEAQLLRQADTSGCREEGLVSFTFLANRLQERKVYLYPQSESRLPDGVRGKALMLSDLRGCVEQLDLSQPELWEKSLNAAGKRLLACYAEIEEELDTIAYQDQDHFTLYFP